MKRPGVPAQFGVVRDEGLVPVAEVEDRVAALNDVKVARVVELRTGVIEKARGFGEPGEDVDRRHGVRRALNSDEMFEDRLAEVEKLSKLRPTNTSTCRVGGDGSAAITVELAPNGANVLVLEEKDRLVPARLQPR